MNKVVSRVVTGSSGADGLFEMLELGDSVVFGRPGLQRCRLLIPFDLGFAMVIFTDLTSHLFDVISFWITQVL